MLAPLRLHKLQALQSNPIEQQRRDSPPIQAAFDRANAQLDKHQLTAAVDTCVKIIRDHAINAVTATNIVLLMRQAKRPGSYSVASSAAVIASRGKSRMVCAANLAAAGAVWMPKPPCPAHQKKFSQAGSKP